VSTAQRRLARELTVARDVRPRWSGVSVRRVLRPVNDAATAARALPDVLETVARSLRSGASLRMAIAEAHAVAPGALADQLQRISTASDRGRTLTQSVDEWAASSSVPGVPLAAAALALASDIGGAAARSLDGVADTLRDRNGLQQEVRALSSQARASALVITLAPLAFAAIAGAADTTTSSFLFTNPFGLACLAAGVVLDGAGAWWMRAIIRRAGHDRDDIAAQQADVIDLFVLALGAGLNLRLAAAAVARRAPPAWRPALAELVERIGHGQRVADALDALPSALGEPARPLARVLTSAERYGTPLLPALERLAIDARSTRRRRAEEAARRIPVKLLFPLVLCVLPAFGLLTVAPLLAGALDALRL
jgi:Flp pilus assembly protein TadB